MNRLLGILMTGGLLLGHGSTSNAQINVQLTPGGRPSVTLGQPTYSQYTNQYGQPTYAQPGYSPRYYAQPGSAQPYLVQPSTAPTYYSSGYSVPPTTYNPGYYRPSTVAPAYAPTYTPPQSLYRANGSSLYGQPAYGTGTGVIINGRTYTIPR